MEEPHGAVKHESDRSSDEKIAHDESNIGTPVNHLVADLPPDPDAHLSAEERAAIVSFNTNISTAHG
jgi:hypothetical protein